MLYHSHAQTKGGGLQAVLTFCKAVLTVSPNALHPAALVNLIGEKCQFVSPLRITRFVGLIESLNQESYQRVLGPVRTSPPRKIQTILDYTGGRPQHGINRFHLFWPLSKQGGINLQIHRGTGGGSPILSFRIPKLGLAQTCANTMDLPSPVGVLDWPTHKSPVEPRVTIVEKEVIVEKKLPRASGVNIPFQDILQFLGQYKTAGTGGFE